MNSVCFAGEWGKPTCKARPFRIVSPSHEVVKQIITQRTKAQTPGFTNAGVYKRRGCTLLLCDSITQQRGG
jgi:hypothetical protein